MVKGNGRKTVQKGSENGVFGVKEKLVGVVTFRKVVFGRNHGAGSPWCFGFGFSGRWGIVVVVSVWAFVVGRELSEGGICAGKRSPSVVKGNGRVKQCRLLW